jgi:Zn finger protein HypA/HybF involved in hydrogenase expression
MFKLDVATVVFLYIMSSLLVVFVLWIFFERTAIFPKFVREEADVWECSICCYTYVDSTHHEISQCPQCGSFNKKSPEDRFV